MKLPKMVFPLKIAAGDGNNSPDGAHAEMGVFQTVTYFGYFCSCPKFFAIVGENPKLSDTLRLVQKTFRLIVLLSESFNVAAVNSNQSVGHEK